MIKVLIVGGGIGGLCSAVALRRVGADVHVVEVNPAWDVYGVGIIQPGNALRALAALGSPGPACSRASGSPATSSSTATGTRSRRRSTSRCRRARPARP